jgi:hypothetical protein
MGTAPSNLQASGLSTQAVSAVLSTETLEGPDPINLKKKTFIFFCTEAWPQYLLGEEKWPSEGSINYNTILQLDLFCTREEK